MKIHELIAQLEKLPQHYYVNDEATGEEITKVIADEESELVELEHQNILRIPPAFILRYLYVSGIPYISDSGIRMKFDLIRPCKLCPFANTATRITFSCRERAEEIEEMAYRQGFVCHEHAELVEDDDYFMEPGGYYQRQDGSSQHCFGALAMHIKNGGSSVPWEVACADDEELEERWWNRADMKALKTVFDNEEDFVAANP